MAEQEKSNGFMDMIKDGLSYIPQIISASIFTPISEGTDMVMKTIENRMIKIENRIFRKISSFLTIWFGMIFMAFAFFFFLIEFFRWNYASAFFTVGIIIFMIGLLLKAGE